MASSTLSKTQMMWEPITRIDMLLVVDNSDAMADKQAVLAATVPLLLSQLFNPPCLDDVSAQPLPPGAQPSGPEEACPVGSRRSFEPVTDIHIGVVSSSLGGQGADACDPAASGAHPTVNDLGQLITRADPDNVSAVETYEDSGFLVWDPIDTAPTHMPQGESELSLLAGRLQQLVMGAGEQGCGYESTLEAWYRFLIDPEPYEVVAVKDGLAEALNADEVVLAQRADFLRPNSLLNIVMLSDENDCSLRVGGQSYLAAQQFQPGTNIPYQLPKPRAACATDPLSACCRSCADPPVEGCDTSLDDCDSGPLSAMDDPVQLRCFDQKRRFGIDFLYPIDRYRLGLMAFQVQDRFGNPQPNPLFDDLTPETKDGRNRNRSMIMLTGIVGVPWQDIARRNEAGEPDLLQGIDALGYERGGVQSAQEMVANGTWELILGDPAKGVPAQDPLMHESIEPRSGVHPITNEPVAPPSTSEPDGNSINGHEYSNLAKDDLQYACIFPLNQPRDCGGGGLGCDCQDVNNDSPLCHDAANPTAGTTQYRAKAYPALRQLQLLKAMGEQGVVASVCPAQQDDSTGLDYGYTYIIQPILDRLSAGARVGACLERSVDVDAAGRADCRVVVAYRDGPCDCASLPGRQTIAADDPIRASIEASFWTDDLTCFCEVAQSEGDNLDACQQDTSTYPVNADGELAHGWCYVDTTMAPALGNPELSYACPAGQKRYLRVANGSVERRSSVFFLYCESTSEGTDSCGPAPP